jgi:hypothetical protein
LAFDRFRESGLKLKLTKCHFAGRSVKCLGHIVSDKIKRVINAGYWVRVFVISLTFRKSTQNLVVLSFFLTKTIGDDQGLFDGLITSRSNISFNNSFTSCFLCMGILLRFCLITGSNPVFMLCLVKGKVSKKDLGGQEHLCLNQSRSLKIMRNSVQHMF